MPTPTTSDLIFSEQANHNFSKTLGELRRSTLSICNRLQSISEDASFAQKVAEAYGRPLKANERCGSWYVDPRHKVGSAYFKSTDGHTSVWKFSSRRLNLHLLEFIGKNDGCIIIDSTRRGKRMPDALSKTIPIWCSVLNRAFFPEGSRSYELHTPPQVVSPSEHTQISALLPSFLESFLALDLPIDTLKTQISKPLRPIWVTPDSDLIPAKQIFGDFHPVICCAVSRRVQSGEVSEGGYIQGAGDDTENWAYGLTPSVFWANQETLLSTSENDLPQLIETLVSQVASTYQTAGEEMKSLKSTSCLYICPILSMTAQVQGACTIVLLPKVTAESTWRTNPTRVDIGIGPHKLGSRNLRIALPYIAEFVERSISRAEPDKESERVNSIIIACGTGKDFSIGVALALLCIFFDENGELLKSQDKQRPNVDKNFIRRRLGWISTSLPDANPSRATLQSVNSFLIERPR